MNMHRAKLFPVYAGMLYFGLLCALLVGDAMARSMGLSPSRVLAAMLLLVPVLLAGARALAVALNWSYYRERPAEILRVEHGGAALYGALPPALLVSVPLLRWLGLPFGTFWDIAAMGILAGMIPTRIGCLSAGCCRGRVVRSRWGEWRLPNPLFEALLGAGLLVFLVALRPVVPFAGGIFLAALGGYAAGRFCLEWLREERVLPAWGLSAFQWISVGCVATCVSGLTIGISASAGSGPAVAALDLGTLALGPAVGRVLGSGVLLFPIMLLFRFLGCSLLFVTGETPRFVVRLNAAIPDLGGSGDFVATMTLEKEADGEEISESPVDLAPAGTLPGGRLVFETLIEIDQNDYRATCLITRPGAIARLGSCTGSLNALDLVVRFVAEENDPPDELRPQLCFEQPPP